MTQAKYPVKSLIKAMNILDVLARHETGLSIAFVSQELKIGKSTVHRLLATLRDHNLVSVDPLTSNYSLGPKILQWSESLRKQILLLRLGVPTLKKLANECHETVNLGVLEGTEVIYLAKLESANTLRVSSEVGIRRPAHCTAMGKILLADLPETELRKLYQGVGQLKAHTASSITGPVQLWDHLLKVRREGVAYDFEEDVEGGICVAGLVRNYSGKGVGAISISMPKQRLSGERLMKFKEYIQEACRELSHQLGYASAPAKPELDWPPGKRKSRLRKRNVQAVRVA